MIFIKTKCFQSICQNMKPDDSVEFYEVLDLLHIALKLATAVH